MTTEATQYGQTQTKIGFDGNLWQRMARGNRNEGHFTWGDWRPVNPPQPQQAAEQPTPTPTPATLPGAEPRQEALPPPRRAGDPHAVDLNTYGIPTSQPGGGLLAPELMKYDTKINPRDFLLYYDEMERGDYPYPAGLLG